MMIAATVVAEEDGDDKRRGPDDVKHQVQTGDAKENQAKQEQHQHDPGQHDAGDQRGEDKPRPAREDETHRRRGADTLVRRGVHRGHSDDRPAQQRPEEEPDRGVNEEEPRVSRQHPTGGDDEHLAERPDDAGRVVLLAAEELAQAEVEPGGPAE